MAQQPGTSYQQPAPLQQPPVPQPLLTLQPMAPQTAGFVPLPFGIRGTPTAGGAAAAQPNYQAIVNAPAAQQAAQLGAAQGQGGPSSTIDWNAVAGVGVPAALMVGNQAFNSNSLTNAALRQLAPGYTPPTLPSVADTAQRVSDWYNDVNRVGNSVGLGRTLETAGTAADAAYMAGGSTPELLALGGAGTEGATTALAGLDGGLGFGDATNYLGATGLVTGPYQLYTGIQTGNPVDIASGVNSLYSGLSTVAPETFTPVSTLAGDAFASLAPQAAAALGIGPWASAFGAGSAGAAGLGSAAASGASAAALADAALGGTTAGLAGGTGAATGILGTAAGAAGVLSPLIVGGTLAIMQQFRDEQERIANQVSNSVAMQQAFPRMAQEFTDAIGASDPASFAALSNEQLLARAKQLEGAFQHMGTYLSPLLESNGSTFPSRVPRMDPTQAQQLMQGLQDKVIPGLAAAQDELARRGMPFDQYFQAGGATDILGLAGGAKGLEALTPQQLAAIGPGNMAAALQAIRAGQPLTGLPSAAAGAADYRQQALAKSLQSGPLTQGAAGAGGSTLGGQTYTAAAPYLLGAQERALLDQITQQERAAASYGQPAPSSYDALARLLAHQGIVLPVQQQTPVFVDYGSGER